MRPLTKVHAILLILASQGLAQTSAVQIHAVDPFGHGLGPISVIRFVEATLKGKDYSTAFIDGRATSIPFGEYIASVRAGGVQLGGPVVITDKETFIVLSGSGQSNEYGSGRVPILKGKLINVPRGTARPIWLRIFSLYGDADSGETVGVGTELDFSLHIWNPGAYLIDVFDDDGLLFNGLLKLDNLRSDVEIDVKSQLLKVRDQAEKSVAR